MASRITPPSFQGKETVQIIENDCDATDLKIKVEQSLATRLSIESAVIH